MKIDCDNLENFLNVIKGLVERGLTFESFVNNFTIKLTGGY